MHYVPLLHASVSLICLSPFFLGGNYCSASALLLTVKLQTESQMNGSRHCSVMYDVSGPGEMCQEMFPVCLFWLLSGAGNRKWPSKTVFTFTEHSLTLYFGLNFHYDFYSSNDQSRPSVKRMKGKLSERLFYSIVLCNLRLTCRILFPSQMFISPSTGGKCIYTFATSRWKNKHLKKKHFRL